MTLSAFTALTRQMSLQDIRTRLGTPTRESAGLPPTLRYDLADGSHVDIVYGAPKTWKCIHYRPDGTRMSWVPQ